MGLTVSVLRDAWLKADCTNGGISGKADRLCVVNVPGPSNPSDDAPAALLVVDQVIGTEKRARLVPAEQDDDGVWHPIAQNPTEYAGPMMGGNYAATCDARFGRALRELGFPVGYIAIPIHDRCESWHLYDAMSRD